MSSSSYFDGFRDGWSVAVQVLLCWVLPTGFVQYCSRHFYVIAVNFFPIRLLGFYGISTFVGCLYILFIRGLLNKFPDVFRMGTFIDSTHMKL